MYSIDVFEAIMNDTTRQRDALLKLFADNRNRIFTRLQIIEEMGKLTYRNILTPDSVDGDNPFLNQSDARKVPTILRDRLADLIGAGVIEMKKSGREAVYQLFSALMFFSRK
jgi:hypothetical protein